MMFAVLLILTTAVSMVAGCCGRWLWFLLWRHGGGSPSSALALAPPAGPPPPPPSRPIPAAAAGPSPPAQPQGVKQQTPDSDSLQKILLKLQALENLLKRSSESESSCRSGHGSREGFTRSEAPRRRRKSGGGGGGGGHSRSGGRDRHDDYWYVFSCCQYSVYCIATYILIYFRMIPRDHCYQYSKLSIIGKRHLKQLNCTEHDGMFTLVCNFFSD